jgi:hypothetical protein
MKGFAIDATQFAQGGGSHKTPKNRRESMNGVVIDEEDPSLLRLLGEGKEMDQSMTQWI